MSVSNEIFFTNFEIHEKESDYEGFSLSFKEGFHMKILGLKLITSPC